MPFGGANVYQIHPMKALRILITLLLFVVFIAPSAHANKGKVLVAIGKIVMKCPKVVGTAAAFLAAAGGAAALNAHLSKGEAVYALVFDLSNDVSSIKWADVFSKPDVFPVLQVAGMGTFLIPEIAQNYAGGKIIWTFKIPKIPNGRDVSITLYDDDSTSDHIWKNILSSRWTVAVNTETSLTKAIQVNANVGTSLQLVTMPIMIDSPEQLCVYSISTPSIYLGGDWDTEADLTDSSGKKVGHMKFSQLINK